MIDPKRHLQKILRVDQAGLDRLESAGEDMPLLVETLREAAKCRSIRQFLVDELHLDPVVAPAEFGRLLAVPEIDTVETANKEGNVERSSLKAERKAEDPVSVAHLNAVLRELNRDLLRVRHQIENEYPDLLLAREMDKDLLDTAADCAASLRKLNRGALSYFFAGWKAKQIETAFRHAFPLSEKAHPLRSTLERVERELVFYRDCARLNEKWGALRLDLFHILRKNGLTQTIENVQQLGNSLWNVVYSGQRLKRSIELVRIKFGDVRTLFHTADLR